MAKGRQIDSAYVVRSVATGMVRTLSVDRLKLHSTGASIPDAHLALADEGICARPRRRRRASCRARGQVVARKHEITAL